MVYCFEYGENLKEYILNILTKYYLKYLKF